MSSERYIAKAAEILDAELGGGEGDAWDFGAGPPDVEILGREGAASEMGAWVSCRVWVPCSS